MNTAVPVPLRVALAGEYVEVVTATAADFDSYSYAGAYQDSRGNTSFKDFDLRKNETNNPGIWKIGASAHVIFDEENSSVFNFLSHLENGSLDVTAARVCSIINSSISRTRFSVYKIEDCPTDNGRNTSSWLGCVYIVAQWDWKRTEVQALQLRNRVGFMYKVWWKKDKVLRRLSLGREKHSNTLLNSRSLNYDSSSGFGNRNRFQLDNQPTEADEAVLVDILRLNLENARETETENENENGEECKSRSIYADCSDVDADIDQFPFKISPCHDYEKEICQPDTTNSFLFR